MAVIAHDSTAPCKLHKLIIASLDWQLTLSFAFGYLAVATPSVMGGSHDPAFLASSLVLGTALVLLSVIDVRFFRLPNALTLPLLAVGLALSFVFQWDDLLWRLAAAAFGFVILYGVAQLYFHIRGRHGLGLGDAKLLAASGAWLGIEGVPTTLLLASVGALCAALVAQLAGRQIATDTRIPFGAFLAGGTWLTWFYGPMI